MTINLTDPIFHDEDAARTHMEKVRWPHGATCPHCGAMDGITLMAGKSHRPGLFLCNGCRGHFTVKTGSVMESSHIPLAKWVLAFHLMAASKKGVSAHQLHRTLGLTYKSAWFMAHRIREAMAPNAGDPPLGGAGKIVEADEAYHGKREIPRIPNAQRKGRPFTKSGKSGGAEKRPIVALVERGGEARATYMHHVTGKNLREYIVKNASRKSRLHTDESNLYPAIGAEFVTHETVNHSIKEYARGDVTTNSVEGFFGIFKRGMVGIYQHCGEQHLQAYLDEFTFRYSNRSALGVDDTQRATFAILGGVGKRLTYEGCAST